MRVNKKKLNNARWAACNTRYPSETPTMEWASALADKILQAYLGIDPDEWEEQVGDG